uniref:Putative takeout length n=2 Tax=Rhodnius prolixus TaxID=13249 RepID=R4G385_RHOPR
MTRGYLLTIFFCLVGLSVAAKMPSKWKTCKRSDKNINECLKKAVEEAVKTLKSGNPSLGVIPLDPLHFNELNIGQGSGPVSINLNFKNMDIHGISTAKVKRFRADWNNYYLEAEATLNVPLVLLGDYTVKGQVLVLPIVGNGKCNLTFDNFVAKLTAKGHEITKGKEKYMEIDKFTFDLETSKLRVFLGNLFNGDKALGNNMNVFLNENWQEILKELKPAISKAFGEAFRSIGNSVFSRIPLNQIAPK